MLLVGLEEGGREACEEVAGTAQERGNGRLARVEQARMERERRNDGAKAQVCSLTLSHREDAPRGRERTGSLMGVGEKTVLVFEHLSSLRAPFCLQREENGLEAPLKECLLCAVHVAVIYPFHRGNN